MKLKVCGMREEINILQVAALKPDYLGFIFYAKSPRFVGDDFEIPQYLSSEIERVGVFVNEDNGEVSEKVLQYDLDYVQLHGSESAEACKELKDKGIGVIKVFSVGDDFDFVVTKPYEKVVDFFLFDTKGKYHGGNAVTFDWSILKKYNQSVPFFLSGGLTPENVQGISQLKGMNLYALDVNSGVESAPGVKDVGKIKLLMERIAN